MKIYCDVIGTVIAGTEADGERLQAVQRMSEAGHVVAFCSGNPDGARGQCRCITPASSQPPTRCTALAACPRSWATVAIGKLAGSPETKVWN